MKRNLIWLIIILTICFSSCKQKTISLHEANIKGKIDLLSEINNYWTIEVNNVKYNFKANSLPGNEFNFKDVARMGDTVIKSHDSDTLYLRRGEIDFGYKVE